MDAKFFQSNDDGAFITLQREKSFEENTKKKTIIRTDISHS